MLNPAIDRHTVNTTNNKKAASTVKQMMDRLKLTDVWRDRNPLVRRYSWARKDNSQASRLDMVLSSIGVDQKIDNVMYLHGYRSDHDALYFCVSDLTSNRGPGYWKLNTSHLRKPEFLQQLIESTEKDINTTTHLQSDERWNVIKQRLQKTLKRLTRKQTSEKNIIISNLSEKLAEMEEQRPLNLHQQVIYNRTEEDLIGFMTEKTNSIKFRCRVKWYEEGEQNTKYFFNLEKRKLQR